MALKFKQGKMKNRQKKTKRKEAFMIEAKNTALTYADGTVGLHPFTLNITAGMLYFITGPSGSGKTSFLHLVTGICRPSAGAFSVLGQDMTFPGSKAVRKLRRQIGPVFQDFRLTPGRTALENVMAGIRFLNITNNSLKEEALLSLDHVGLANKAFAQVEHLSWGERQRVSIARAVARKPQLILADEPTGTLDKENALLILSLLTGMRNENTTVIITTHATHLIEDYPATGIIEMEKGTMMLV